MPRKPCYWSRKLELDLVEFVREREFMWKPSGNTNHQIKQKYKAYAQFAAKLGRGFTARSVRDRWVNIRSTFNHNQRRVDKSKETATSLSDVYVPCWPLWKPLQFLREGMKKEDTENFENCSSTVHQENPSYNIKVKEETQSELEELDLIQIRQRGQRTDLQQRKLSKISKNTKCKQIIDDLVTAMRPLVAAPTDNTQTYWFFGRHVTERLNSMREVDALSASRDIMKLLDELPSEELT